MSNPIPHPYTNINLINPDLTPLNQGGIKFGIKQEDISDVNVEELIRSHCVPKLNSIDKELQVTLDKLTQLILEQARLKAHALIQEAFDKSRRS